MSKLVVNGGVDFICSRIVDNLTKKYHEMVVDKLENCYLIHEVSLAEV